MKGSRTLQITNSRLQYSTAKGSRNITCFGLFSKRKILIGLLESEMWVDMKTCLDSYRSDYYYYDNNNNNKRFFNSKIRSLSRILNPNKNLSIKPIFNFKKLQI